MTDDPGLVAEADLVVCGPAGIEAYAGHAARVPVVALSLRPLGGRFTEALPTGVVDYGDVVLAQPDAFVATDPPADDDPGWRDAGGTRSQGELLATGAGSGLVSPGGRLLTDRNPCTRDGLPTLLGPVTLGSSVVWVRNPVESSWELRAEQERVTDQSRR